MPVEVRAMTLEGRVENGAIVLVPPTPLPKGARVRVEVISDDTPTLLDRLGRFAGAAQHLPSDASVQYDHYLHGTPRKP
jgi:hypothetical protein